MARSFRWDDRIGGAAGIAFVGLFFASVEFGGSSFSGPDQTSAAIAADLLNRFEGLKTSVALVGLAAVAGFWFVGSLHRRLADRGSSAAGWAAFAGGVAMVTVVLAGSAITGAAVTVDSLFADPQVAQTLWLLEQSFFDVLIGPPLIVFALGVSIVSIKQGDPSRWLGWSGIPVIIGLIVNYPLALGSLAALGFVWVLALAVNVTLRSPQQNVQVQQQPNS